MEPPGRWPWSLKPVPSFANRVAPIRRPASEHWVHRDCDPVAPGPRLSFDASGTSWQWKPSACGIPPSWCRMRWKIQPDNKPEGSQPGSAKAVLNRASKGRHWQSGVVRNGPPSSPEAVQAVRFLHGWGQMLRKAGSCSNRIRGWIPPRKPHNSASKTRILNTWQTSPWRQSTSHKKWSPVEGKEFWFCGKKMQERFWKGLTWEPAWYLTYHLNAN